MGISVEKPDMNGGLPANTFSVSRLDRNDNRSLSSAAQSTDERSAHEAKSEKSCSASIRSHSDRFDSTATESVSPTSSAEATPAPDGGLRAWTQVAMGWIVMFTAWGWVVSYGAFQDYYAAKLPESASTISWIGAVQNCATFFVGAFSGRLLDAGYFVPTLIAGSLLQVTGMFLMSISTRYWQLLITQGLMTGIGGGIYFTPALGLMGTYFSSRRAIALGISTTGNSVGGIIYPILVQQLLPRLGFAWTVRVLGFLNLALLSLVLALMRPRLPPRKSGPLMDLAAFKEPSYAFYVACLFFIVWPIYYTFYYLALFGSEKLSMPFSTSTSIVILINAAGIPARIIPPYFADRFGQLNVVVPVVAVLTVVAFVWPSIHHSGGLWVFAVFYGFFSAAFQGLIGSSIASMTPDMSTIGTRLGMAFTVLSLAALTGPPLGGALQAADGGRYLGAQLWAATSTAICLALVVAARVSRTGWKLSVKC